MPIDYQAELEVMGQNARKAARRLALMSAPQKNQALQAIAEAIREQQETIFAANALDMKAGEEKGLTSAMLDRLRLTPQRIEDMIKGLQTLIGLPDSVGNVDSTWLRPNGMKIQRIRVPIGVIAIIYESRPNVTVDAGSICLKAGNAVILRGGSEAFHSNQRLAEVMMTAGAASGLPEGTVQLMPWTDRAAIAPLLRMNQYIDLVIPRGGEGLIRNVVENATMPVIKHYKGVCHIYVDEKADFDMALRIIENAKCQRPGVCNAVETLLVHKDIAAEFAPRLAELLEKRQVEMRGDAAFCKLVPQAKLAQEQDWYEEYLDLIVSIRVVDSLEEAVEHVAKYGSAHSDVIITENRKNAAAFTEAVDSAVVYVNASTRFTDGSEFGMGAEIGISTDRIHARGPMGVAELTTYKYVAIGSGQIRE